MLSQPFGFPTGKNFQYAYSNQVNFGIERDLGHDYSINLAYNFNGDWADNSKDVVEAEFCGG